MLNRFLHYVVVILPLTHSPRFSLSLSVRLSVCLFLSLSVCAVVLQSFASSLGLASAPNVRIGGKLVNALKATRYNRPARESVCDCM